MATNPNPQCMYIEYIGKRYNLRAEDGTIIGVFEEEEIISLINRIRERSPRIMDEDADRLLAMINELSTDTSIIRLRDYVFDFIKDDIDFDAVDFDDAVFSEVDDTNDHMDYEDIKRPNIEDEEEQAESEEEPRDVTPKESWFTKFANFIKGLTKKGLITIGAAVVLLFIILKFSISSPQEQAPANEPLPTQEQQEEEVAADEEEGQTEKVDTEELLKRTEELEQPEVETSVKEDKETSVVAKEPSLTSEGAVTSSTAVIKAILSDVNKEQVRLTETTQQEIELISSYLQGEANLMQVRAKVNVNKNKKQRHADEVEKILSRLDGSYDEYKRLTVERMQVQLDMHDRITASNYDPAELSMILQEVVTKNEDIRQREIRALADALIHNDIPFTTDETGVVIQ